MGKQIKAVIEKVATESLAVIPISDKGIFYDMEQAKSWAIMRSYLTLIAYAVALGLGTLLVVGLWEFASSSIAMRVRFLLIMLAGSLSVCYGIWQIYKYYCVGSKWLDLIGEKHALRMAYYCEPTIKGQPILHSVPVILYEYTYNEKSYQSTRMAIHPLNLVQELSIKNIVFQGVIDDDMSRWWKQARLQDTIRLYVNPNKPNQSIIKTPNSLKIPIINWLYIVVGTGAMICALSILI